MKTISVYGTRFYLLWTVGLWLSGGCLFAQSSFTSSQVLQQIIRKKTLELPYQSSLQYFRQSRLSLPLLGKINFRTETDELDFSQQHYQIRFNFNSGAEQRAFNHLMAANKTELMLIRQEYLTGIIQEAYKNMIEIHFLTQKNKIAQEELVVLDDSRKVYHNMLKSGKDIDVDDWLSLEDERMSLKREILRNKQAVERAYASLQNDIEQPVQLHFDGWIPVKEIQDRIAGDAFSGVKSALKRSNLRVEKAKAAWEWENAKAKKIFDFIQFQYKRNEKLPLPQEISVGASFDIPAGLDNRMKKNKAKLLWLKEEDKKQWLFEKQKKNISSKKRKLQQLLQEYDLLLDLTAEQQLTATYRQYAETHLLSPLPLLKMKNRLLKRKEKKCLLEKKIYDAYLEYLFEAGKLMQYPLHNYFEQGSPELIFDAGDMPEK